MGDCVGVECGFDVVVGVFGLLVVFEVMWCIVGWVLLIFFGVFVFYVFVGFNMFLWFFLYCGYLFECVVV